MGTELIPMVFTSGWASGINAYAVVLVLGLAERFFTLGQIPDALARTDVLVGAAVLFVIEMVADKIPWLDSVWDSVHTVVRPAVGATIGYLIGNQTADLDAAIGAATGGITALASHLVKAGLRAGINTSPEPVSNIVVSTGEDVTVVGVTALALANPWAAAAIAFVLLALGAFIAYKIAGRVRRLKHRYDDWGERTGIAEPRGERGPRGAPGGPHRAPSEPAGPAGPGSHGARASDAAPGPGPSSAPPRRPDDEPFDQAR